VPYLIPRSQTTTLDGSGNGQVSFVIDNTNVRWIIDTVHVATVDASGNITTTPVPQAKTYRNQVSPQTFAGGTFSGNFDTASGRVILYTGDTLFVVWTGGVPGSFATATIEGTFDPRGTPLQDA
jgi:hypothetical protein